jgi:hypothetical protein
MDAYFEELHKLWASGEAPSREAERELMSRYGMEGVEGVLGLEPA